MDVSLFGKESIYTILKVSNKQANTNKLFLRSLKKIWLICKLNLQRGIFVFFYSL